MQKDVEINEGILKSRQRALRLVRRVAKAINELKDPTNDDIIDLCTEITTQNCTDIQYTPSSVRFLPRRLSLSTLADYCWP